MALSSWYAPTMSTSGEFQYTYPFNSPNQYPDYKQPYNTPIDSSIWLIIRPNNEYAYGNTFSQWYTEKNKTELKVYEHKNGFSVNPSCLTTNPTSGKWAPFVISSTANVSFIKTFDYSKLMLVPTFYYITPDDLTGNLRGTYDEIPDDAMIQSISLNYYYGNANSRYGQSNMSVLFTQNAYGYYKTRDYGEAYEYDSGTFYHGPLYGDYMLLSRQGHTLYYAKNANQYVIENYKDKQYYPISLFNTYLVETDAYTYYYHWVTKETAYKMVSALGYYWATNYNSAQAETGINCTDDGVVLPVINPENNTVTDRTIRGREISEDAIANPDSNSNWTNDLEKIRENTPQDSTQETDEIELNYPNLGAVGAFNNYFVLNQDNVNAFAGWLWNKDGNIFDQIAGGLVLMGANPIDAVISLTLYPFEIGNFFDKEYKTIFFGRTESPILGQRLNKSYTVIDLGTATFSPSTNDFTAYEPYTKAWLYIPYCGIVSVSPSEFVNKTISIKMVIDITTGNCTAVVYSAGIPVMYKDGVIGANIPVTGINQSEWANNFISGAVNTGANFATGVASGILSGGAGLATTLGLGVIQGAYDISQSIGTSIEKTGSSTPITNTILPQKCYLIFESLETAIPDDYGHTVGFTCMYNDVISNFTGFSIFGNIDTSSISNATAKERQEIKELLESGVYL